MNSGSMPVSFYRNPRQYIDPTHPQYTPSIYAAPAYKPMLLSQVSGFWRQPLAKFMELMAKGSVSSVDDFVKAGMTKYEAETLKELVKINKFAASGE